MGQQQRCNVTILSSQRLTKSFQKIKEDRTYQSIGLTVAEAQQVMSMAIKKMTKDSDPLTITVTINA